MRPGGAKAKGSAWERQVGKQLSLWLTSGERDDLFTRTVLSGGQFTVRAKQGKGGGNSGDLMANGHPVAYRFLQHFSIECKHWKEADLASFLLKNSPKSSLAKAIRQASEDSDKHFLLVVKENFAPPFVIMPRDAPIYLTVSHHVIFNRYTLTLLEDLLRLPLSSMHSELIQEMPELPRIPLRARADLPTRERF